MTERKGHILVVDDEESMRRFFSLTLKREGYRITTAESVKTGLEALAVDDFDLVLSDVRLGDGQGLEILAKAKEKDPDIPVLMITAYSSAETAVEAMKLGAADYLAKPFNIDEVRIVVHNNIRTRALAHENRELRAKLAERESSSLIYQSAKMKNIIDLIERVSKMDATILVTGESGTGKELIMREIHKRSDRSRAPFVSVNCGALPESLFESEFFGYEKGAFTGADQLRRGLFESADQGTLFLDEVGELPARMQIKLLRVLQEKKIRRVGGVDEIPVDVRLLAATNRNLENEVRDGNFRQDLYYRINVIPVELPPLRERKEDILPLTKYFLKKFAEKMDEAVKEITPSAIARLEQYDWPGNVRELEHVIERTVALTMNEEIDAAGMSLALPSKSESQSVEVDIPEEGMDLEAWLDDLRCRYMQRGLDMSGGVQSKACELLGMSLRSFRYYLSKTKKQDEA